MAPLTITGGARYDVASPAEIREIMVEQLRERERARGIKDIRRSVLLNTPAASHVTIADGIACPAGYKWVIRLVGLSLAASGFAVIYITSDPNASSAGVSLAMCVGSMPSSAGNFVQTYGNGACVLSEGEGLLFSCGQNVTGYLIAGWQVPAERIGMFA